MDNFYEIAEQCHKDRIREQRNDINNIAKLEYSLFCIWCRAFKNSDFSEQNFKQYVKTERDLNFWVKKRIFELFFNYEFNFNHDSNKWQYHKKYR